MEKKPAEVDAYEKRVIIYDNKILQRTKDRKKIKGKKPNLAKILEVELRALSGSSTTVFPAGTSPYQMDMWLSALFCLECTTKVQAIAKLMDSPRLKTAAIDRLPGDWRKQLIDIPARGRIQRSRT